MNKTTKILLGLLGVSLFIFAGIHMLEEKEIYELSREMVKEGEFYYQKKEYKKARLFFERALKRYNNLIVLRLIKSDEIKQLEKRLNTDPILQKVAQGYIYYNGKWVNEKELEALMKEKRRLKQKIDIYLKTAKFFGSIEDIENNIRIYQKALNDLENSPFKEDRDIQELKKKLISKIIFLAEEAVKKYRTRGNLEKIARYYQLILQYRDDPAVKKELYDTYIQIYNELVEEGEYLRALSVLLKAKELNVDNKSLLPKIEYVLSQIEVEDLKGKNIHDSYVYYVLAKKSYSRFDIVEAQELVEKALKLDPDNIPAKILYARILLSTGEAEKAREIIRQVLSKEPDNIDAILLAGDIYLKLGEIEQAVSYYEKAKGKAEIKDRLFKAYKKLGLAYMKKGEISRAEKYLREAAEIKDDPEIYKALGDIYLSQKKYTEAEKNYLKALKIDPDLRKELGPKLGEIYLSQGEIYFKQKKYRRAIKELKKAIRYLGNRQDILRMLAESYEKSGDMKTALSYYKKIKSGKAKEKEAQLYLKLGEEAYRKGSYFTALKHFNRAISINKNLESRLRDKIIDSYIKIADRYLKNGEYSKAITYYQKAINMDKSIYDRIKNRLFESYKKYGIQLFKHGQYQTALKYLKKAEELGNKDPQLNYYLGELFFREGNYKKALKYFEKYAEEKPSDPEILKRLAFIHAKLGNLKKARMYAEKLLKTGKNTDLANFIIGAYYYYYEKNPEKALTYFLKAENTGYKKGDLYYYLGRIYYDKGNYLRAITYLTEAINKGYKTEKVYYLRALSYLKLKDYRKAINDLTMVIKYNPENGKAYFLRGKLYYEHGNYVKGEYKKAIEDLEKAAAMGIKEAEKLLTEARTKK
ncbi:tetratricopeptide repeat protein [Persephonella sp.]